MDAKVSRPWDDLLRRYSVLNELEPEVQRLLNPQLPPGKRLTISAGCRIARKYAGNSQLERALKVVSGKISRYGDI